MTHAAEIFLAAERTTAAKLALLYFALFSKECFNQLDRFSVS